MLTDELFPQHQHFSVDNLEVIHRPEGFFSTLKSLIKRSIFRIFIGTLYIGKEIKEKILIDLLKKKSFNPLIVVDANRSIKEETGKSVDYKFTMLASKKTQSFLPFAINEALQVYHKKIFVFDDEVILTGANMAQRYFTTTRDRYFKIKDKNLANFLVEMLKSDTSMTFELPLSNIRKKDKILITPFEGKDEINVMKTLLSQKKFEKDKIFLTTAYVNFPDEYKKLFKEYNVKLSVPAEKFNTHNNSLFIDKIIKKVYNYFIYQIKKLGAKIVFLDDETERYHKKGLWIFDSGGEYAITIIGSTNFNYRSIWRDKELSFIIETTDKEVIKELKKEVERIENWSRKTTLKQPSFIFRLIGWIFKSLF